MNQNPALNTDFRDILLALNESQAQYLLIGAHALAVHGIPRATGDLDILVNCTLDNSERVLTALIAFGAPVENHGVTATQLAVPGTIYQIGLPPRRIDIITQIDGVTFEQAWACRDLHTMDEIPVPVINREMLLINKKATGREKDALDVILLQKQNQINTSCTPSS